MKQLLLIMIVLLLSVHSFGQTAPNYTPTLPEYQSTVPLNLLMKAGERRQALYDKRKAWLQDEIDKIGDAINKYIIKDYPANGKGLNNELDAIVDDINSGNHDLSLDAIFNPIATNLMNLGREVNETYNNLQTAQKSSIANVINTYNSYSTYPTIKDGTHKVYLTDGVSGICYTECDVANLKIEDVRTCDDYKRNPNSKDGDEVTMYELMNTPIVSNAKATIAIKNTKYEGNKKYMTIYFIDDITNQK